MTENDNKLARCLFLVAEESGLGESNKWTKRDFEQLSLLIEQKTRIILSISTLTRLYKESSGHKPQKSTLEALARYIGFDSWHAFCTCADIANLANHKVTRARRKFKPLYAIYPAGFFALLIIGYFGTKALFVNRSVHPDDIRFTIRNTEITGIPATIQVDYDLGNFKPDSLWLQLYWNPEEKIMVDPAQKHTTAIYCYPGIHWCKFIADNKVIGEQMIKVKTSGWAALIRHSGLQLVPLYIRNSDVIHDGVLQVTEPMVNTQNLEPNSRILTSYYYVNNLGPISSDDYIISGKVMNPPTTLGTQPCGYCTIYVLCEKGRHYFTIGELGCSALFNLGFSGSERMETFPDLTNFEYVSSGWTSFKSVVSGNTVNIYVANSKVYSFDQVTSLGKIMGIHFLFSGLGAIDKVKLYNSKNFVAMDEDFE